MSQESAKSVTARAMTALKPKRNAQHATRDQHLMKMRTHAQDRATMDMSHSMASAKSAQKDAQHAKMPKQSARRAMMATTSTTISAFPLVQKATLMLKMRATFACSASGAQSARAHQRTATTVQQASS